MIAKAILRWTSLSDAEDLVARVVTRHDLDAALRYTEMRGDQLAHGRIGLIVDGCGSRSHQQTPAAVTADLVALGSRNHPDREACRVGLVGHDHDDTTAPIETKSQRSQCNRQAYADPVKRAPSLGGLVARSVDGQEVIERGSHVLIVNAAPGRILYVTALDVI